MKKLVSKLRRKKQADEPAGRITTDTLAAHREQVLAGGRKFKYPVQYARHRLVINTIIISIAAVALLVTLFWWLLYQAQNTSDFMYRVTKVVPVPVAIVDGQQVRYSDYLMKYRSAIHYLEEKEQIDITTEDGSRQADFVKNQAMSDALADAYAVKIADERDISVTDAELETFLKLQRQSADGEVKESTYNAVILDYYGWSPEEYRHAMKSKLLRQKVAYAVDERAEKISSSIERQIAGGATDLNAVTEAENVTAGGSVTYWPAAWVPKENQDGGLAIAAAGLEKGQISEPIKTTSGDGFYFVKLVDSNETQVQYEYIHISLNTFSEQLAAIEAEGNVSKFITIPEINT